MKNFIFGMAIFSIFSIHLKTVFAEEECREDQTRIKELNVFQLPEGNSFNPKKIVELPDGGIAMADNNHILFFDANGKLDKKILVGEGIGHSISLGPNGRIVSASSNGTSATSRGFVRILNADGVIEAQYKSPEGRYLFDQPPFVTKSGIIVVGEQYGYARFLNLQGESIKSVPVGKGVFFKPEQFVELPDGGFAMNANERFYIYDANANPKKGSKNGGRFLSSGPDGRIVGTFSDGSSQNSRGFVRILNADGVLEAQYKGSEWSKFFDQPPFVTKNGIIVVGEESGYARFLNLQGKSIKRVPVGKGVFFKPEQFVELPDGGFAMGANNRILIYDANANFKKSVGAGGRFLSSGANGRIVDTSSDGSSKNSKGIVRILNADGELEAQYKGPEGSRFDQSAFVTKNGMIVIGGEDGKVRFLHFDPSGILDSLKNFFGSSREKCLEDLAQKINSDPRKKDKKGSLKNSKRVPSSGVIKQ
ncbi:MAG: hypothetical protein OXB88_05835 [Bacteriovoracales bacterium]|nr:hypothetical protein [Bacteriovoracales bacterium]